MTYINASRSHYLMCYKYNNTRRINIRIYNVVILVIKQRSNEDIIENGNQKLIEYKAQCKYTF